MKTVKTKKSWRFASFATSFLLIVVLLFSTRNTGSSNVSDISRFRTISDFSNIDRETWKALDSRIKIPVYKTFSKEKKQVFWRLKLAELESLDWSKAELKHIRSLYSIICENPNLLEHGLETEETEDRFNIFLYNWKEEASDVLGWNKQQIYAVSGTGDQILNTRGEPKVFAPLTVEIDFVSLTRSSFDLCNECEGQEDGAIIPYPGTCSWYYICSWGVAFAMPCPAGLYFDAEIKCCNWPEMSGCEIEF